MEARDSAGVAAVPSADWDSLHVLVATSGHVPSWPGPHDRPRVLVEAPGGHWRATQAAEAAGLQVLTCPGPRSPQLRCPVLAGRPCPLAAAADAIVVAHPIDDVGWQTLMEQHRPQHPGVPICVDHVDRQVCPAGALQLPEDADDRTMVTLVREVAQAHAARADLWVGGPGT